MINKPDLATHYSPSRNEYYFFDNACFVWSDELEQWIEYLGIGHIEDLINL